MNNKLPQVHKTDVISNHVLNLRGVKTPRAIQLAAAREVLKNKRKIEKAKQLQTLQKTQEKIENQEKSIPSKYAKHFTLSLSPIKTLTLFLIVVINLSAVFIVGPTNSYYSDSENSDTNVIASGLVDFTLETTPFEGNASTSDVETWEVDVIPHEESNPFYYYASSTNFSGNLELCGVISVKATLDGEVMYEGLLSEMVTASTTLISQWSFEFSGAVGFPGDICHFDIDFNGWQTRHGIDEGGYNDTETVTYWILDPSLVINKVYFAESSSTQDWVELYNPTDGPLDISEGFLCDNNSCDLFPAVPPIPAGGYALVAGSADILTQVDVPVEVVLILVPDGVIGDGLTRSGDMLELRLSLGQPIDRLNWGDIDVGWPNYTDELWDPSLPVPDAGGAFARMPTGVDTNTPEDFEILMLPEVEISEPNIGSLWQADSEETIEWTATNPNGDDEDLRIDIYYIDASSTMNVIALDTENDGEFDWEVQGAEQSTISIKIVATGPENILLNAIARSESIIVQCGENSTAPQCNGVRLHMSKAISGDSQGYELSDFSYRVTGDGVDAVVPHDNFILLQEGTYNIEELVPEDFVKADWRIGWYGQCESGSTFFTTITVEERHLDWGTLYCQADNQYRPKNNSENGGESETSSLEERRENRGGSSFVTADEESATSTEETQPTSTSTEETNDEPNATTTSTSTTTTESSISTSTETEIVSESVTTSSGSSTVQIVEVVASSESTVGITEEGKEEPVLEVEEEPEEVPADLPPVPEATKEEIIIE